MLRDNKDYSRFKFMNIVLILIFLVLVGASFKLMVLEGDHYREIADTKRIKDVHISAPRGNIYDRNGKLLAGSRSSLSVQLLADELGRMDEKKVNEEFAKLIKLLDEDGANYIEETAIDMYVFSYRERLDYFIEKYNPNDYVVNTIIDKKLVGDLLSRYTESFGRNYTILNKALNALESKGIIVPLKVEVKDGKLSTSYIKGEALNNFVEKYKVDLKKDPITVVNELVNNNKTILRKILGHPLSRKICFELLEEKGLKGKLVLEEYSNMIEMDALLNIVSINKEFPSINLETPAKDAFVEIVKKASFEYLVQMYDIDEKGNKTIPAEILMDMLKKESSEEIPVKLEIDDEKHKVNFAYLDEKMETDEKPLDLFIRLVKKAGIEDEFILDDKVKFLAQEANTNLGITPQISILDWTYIKDKENKDLHEKYDIELGSDGEEILKKIKAHYKLESENNIEAISIIALHTMLEKQGHLSYQPLNIAYGVKESTAMKVEEQIGNYSGIHISPEPIRYYPEGELAAHILGYIGKIAQPDEVRRYIEEAGYSQNELIGKTGVEESFESALRGIDGKQVVEVDSVGNRTRVLKEEAPKQGASVYLTADLELQKVAEDALKQTIEKLKVGGEFESKWGNAPLRTNEAKGRPYVNASSGAVVVLDVKTGEILALANQKTYDPNLFATGISLSDWKSLFPEDENNPIADRPLYNIAMQSEVQPGSTFKLITSLAALEKGFDPNREIECTGYIEMGDHVFGCWIWNMYKGSHGFENVFGALRDSCNYYFYALALGENPTTGDQLGMNVDVNDIRKTAIKLGLDNQSGLEINIPYESDGSMPNPEEKKQTIKYLLQDFLEENLDKYYKDKKKPNPVEVKKIKQAILDLIDTPELTRDEVNSKLEELNLDTELIIPGKTEQLADILTYTYVNQAKWNITDMLNVVIGQGQNAYTPLQMANMVSVFANGGYKNKTSIVKEVRSNDDKSVLFKNENRSTKIELNNYKNLEYVAEGMNLASKFGSLDTVFGSFPVEVAIKTGTAERGGKNPETGEGYDDYSWMVAFAPYDNPQIAIATLLFQGGSGANGAPIVREIAGKYLGLEPENTEEGNSTEEEGKTTQEGVHEE